MQLQRIDLVIAIQNTIIKFLLVYVMMAQKQMVFILIKVIQMEILRLHQIVVTDMQMLTGMANFNINRHQDTMLCAQKT